MLPCLDTITALPARIVESWDAFDAVATMSPPAVSETVPPSSALTRPSVTACSGASRFTTRKISPVEESSHAESAERLAVVIGRGCSKRPMLPDAVSVTLSAVIPSMPVIASIVPPYALIDTLFDAIDSRRKTAPFDMMRTPASAEPVNDRPMEWSARTELVTLTSA